MAGPGRPGMERGLIMINFQVCRSLPGLVRPVPFRAYMPLLATATPGCLERPASESESEAQAMDVRVKYSDFGTLRPFCQPECLVLSGGLQPA